MGLFTRLEILKLRSLLPSKLYHYLKGYKCFLVWYETIFYDCFKLEGLQEMSF